MKTRIGLKTKRVKDWENNVISTECYRYIICYYLKNNYYNYFSFRCLNICKICHRETDFNFYKLEKKNTPWSTWRGRQRNREAKIKMTGVASLARLRISRWDGGWVDGLELLGNRALSPALLVKMWEAHFEECKSQGQKKKGFPIFLIQKIRVENDTMFLNLRVIVTTT